MSEKKSKIERLSEVDPLLGYSVECGQCKDEFNVTMYPTYCVGCGEELEPKE